MKEKRILTVLSLVDERYILEAVPGAVLHSAGKSTVKRRSVGLRLAAAAAAVVLVCLLFFRTPLGVKAAEAVRGQVEKIIETLFPPKEIPIVLEGIAEEVPHTAQGKEPEEAVPGFAVYVDPESYVMTEEGGTFYIRPISEPISREELRQNNSALLEGLSPEEVEAEIDRLAAEQEAFYAALPPCELEIREFTGLTPEEAVEAARARFAEWETVTETGRSTEPDRLYFSAVSGSAWDSPCEDHYFYDNGRGGVFHLTARYFLEATEGHGTRLHTMLDTFSILPSAERSSSGPSGATTADPPYKKAAEAGID